MPKKAESSGEPKKNGVRARGYCFTINNPTEEDTNLMKAICETAQYAIVGKEVGEKGTPHFQGYMYFKNAKAFSSVKDKLPRAHIEVSKGDAQQNKEYCSKQEVYLERGEMPDQGKRHDLDAVREMIKKTPKMREVVEEVHNMQQVKFAEVYLKYHEPARSWKPEIRWYHGSTGSGKTRAAREWLGQDIYTCLDGIKWWEGYDGHESVLIDDFRKDYCKFHQLLKLLDRYEYRVETKGGSRQLLAKKIAITSPYPPNIVYSTREDVQQLLRRIDQVVLLGTPVEEMDE